MEYKQTQMVLNLDENFIVIQDNSLIMSNYDMTSLEQKLLLILLSTIKKEDTELKTTSFRIIDLAEIMNVSTSSLYRDLKKICKSIVGRMVELQDKDGSWIVFNIISYAKYIKNKGTIELKINNDAKPYVLALKEFFTSFKLGNALNIDGKYAIRLYQIAKSNIYRKSFIIELEKLKKLLKLTQKSYNLYSNIKLKVIEPAIAEINNKTDITVDFEEIKVGRKVEFIKFKVRQKDKIIVKNKTLSKSNIKKSSFNNFEPRQYDYDKLEKQLLGWDD